MGGGGGVLGCRGRGRRVGGCIGLCGGGSLPSRLSIVVVSQCKEVNNGRKLTVGATLRDAIIAV